MNEPKNHTVTKAYERLYNDPITLKQGERVRVTKLDLWDGVHPWRWCINAAQKEGWVPESYLLIDGEEATAKQEYSAWELTVAQGEFVRSLYGESGWYWCENTQGEQGWIPANCLSE
jgi:hypothetical protein